ncbi:hypothetical protein RJT34_24074 [Clitoria ternatea]|uniref:Uncharacterized protein n=1 Tax=Clitoria ternatea TaxID=43366 RepID=A0AAN9FQ39_CLITE
MWRWRWRFAGGGGLVEVELCRLPPSIPASPPTPSLRFPSSGSLPSDSLPPLGLPPSLPPLPLPPSLPPLRLPSSVPASPLTLSLPSTRCLPEAQQSPSSGPRRQMFSWFVGHRKKTPRFIFTQVI